MSVNVACTPATVSVDRAAGGGRVRSDAQPTPIWRCGSSPESQETTIAATAGSGAVRVSRSAMRAILVSRDDVAPTSIDVATTSCRSTVASLAWLGDNPATQTR